MNNCCRMCLQLFSCRCTGYFLELPMYAVAKVISGYKNSFVVIYYCYNNVILIYTGKQSTSTKLLVILYGYQR